MDKLELAAALATFREGGLYAHILKCKEEYKRERIEVLIQACLRSHDAQVNALAQNILSEEMFWVELRNIDADAEAIQSETPATEPRSELDYGSP